jgi:phosphoenolpyruvate carboxykinase (ATP)
VPTVEDPVFGVQVPTRCPGIPDAMLRPRQTWADPAAYDRTAGRLAALFRDNFARFAASATEDVRAAGPRV